MSNEDKKDIKLLDGIKWEQSQVIYPYRSLANWLFAFNSSPYYHSDISKKPYGETFIPATSIIFNCRR